MAERENYFIRVKGRLVPVTEEVYTEYHRMDRRERYLEERDLANGKVLYSDMDNGEILGEETIPDIGAESVEETAIGNIMVGKLNYCLEVLTETERELINALYFDGYSEREWSAITGIPRKTIGDRRARILNKLKSLLES